MVRSIKVAGSVNEGLSHVYAAPSDKPTPLVCFIHGGGWVNGDKSEVGSASIKALHEAGISVAAIDDRFVRDRRRTQRGIQSLASQRAAGHVLRSIS